MLPSLYNMSPEMQQLMQMYMQQQGANPGLPQTNFSGVPNPAPDYSNMLQAMGQRSTDSWASMLADQQDPLTVNQGLKNAQEMFKLESAKAQDQSGELANAMAMMKLQELMGGGKDAVTRFPQPSTSPMGNANMAGIAPLTQLFGQQNQNPAGNRLGDFLRRR